MSLSTVISIVLVTVVPSGFWTVTVTWKLRVSSVVPQSVIFGVPLIVLVEGSYVTPFGRLGVSTVTTDAGSPGVITIFVIGLPSITVWIGLLIVGCATGVITAAGLELASFGSEPAACSTVSGIPSPSSSVSVTSGVPSPSVSRCTVILIFLFAVVPSGFWTVTGISNVRVSSVGVQFVTSGVPLIVLVAGL